MEIEVMKLGINGTGLVQKASVKTVIANAQQAAADGFSHYWLAEHPTGGFDAITTLALVGAAVPGIEVGTAIVPTFPRHPMALAGQALTAANAIDGRFTLGIGLSHEPMMAELGIAFDKPIRHLREYLSILMPLLCRGEVVFDGEMFSTTGRFFQPPQTPVPVLVAALGPQALKVAGELADGTTLAWVGPKTVKEHIVPCISEAASIGDRPKPRVLATLPVCVTDDKELVSASIGRGLSMYGTLPSYRAMFDREGVDGPADLAIVGSAAEVADGIAAMAAAGVTDFAPSEYCLTPQQRQDTRLLLKTLVTEV